jgi:hypothetical protein
MQKEPGIIGVIFRQMVEGSSAPWLKRVINRLRECEVNEGACRIRIYHTQDEITIHRQYYRQTIAIHKEREEIPYPDPKVV